MNDLISREAAIAELKEHRALYCDNTPDKFSKLSYAEKSRVDELDTAIATLVNLPPAQQWIPIKYRKITEDEVAIFYEMEFKFGFIGADEVVFECTMPEYVQEIFISTDDGRVENDVCLIRDNVYYLEERIDFYGVVAWMPLDKPEPYKGGTNE